MRTRRLPWLVALTAAALGMPALAAADPPEPSSSSVSFVDERLCPFPLRATYDARQLIHVVSPRGGEAKDMVTGPISVTLDNLATGFRTRLEPIGQGNVTITADSLKLSGRQILLLGGLPIAELHGTGEAGFDDFVLERQTGTERLVDPCRLVEPTLPAPAARVTPEPWDAPTDVLGGIALAGLTPPWFGFVEHIHAHLDVFVDGRRVPVPAGVGVAEPVVVGGQTVSAIGLQAPVHTHDDTGVLHIENDGPPLVLTLGDFFNIWMVRLTADCLGPYCADGTRTVRVYVDGGLVPGDPREVVLAPAIQIALVFGPPSVPAQVPATYEFPPGTEQTGFPGRIS